MYIIINTFDKKNIIYETKNNKIVLKYKMDDFKILGIPLKIKYDEFQYNNHITNVYISDTDTLNILEDIQSNCKLNYNLIKVNRLNNKKYITCKNKVKNELLDYLHISIVKIYNNNYYNYII